MRCRVAACVLIVFIKVIASNVTTSSNDTTMTTTDSTTVTKIVLRKRHEIPKEYTFIVLLHRLILTNNLVKLKLCTGSVINKSWVLTAAHCLVKIPPDKVMFKNIPFPFNPKYEVKVKKTIPYPTYRIDINGQARHDIGIVKTDPIPTNNDARLSAIDITTLTGVPVMFAGINYFEDENEHSKLGYFDLKKFSGIISPCSFKKTHWQPHFCVVNQCSQKFFDEDTERSTGGPMFYHGKIIGVVNGMELSTVVSFTPLNPYLDWIRNIVS